MISPALLSCGVIVCIDSLTDSPPEELQRLIVSVACFLLMLSCRDAIDIGCIDRAITATLETARVSGGGECGGRGRMRVRGRVGGVGCCHAEKIIRY